MHLHNKVANNDKGFRQRHTATWSELSDALTKYKVDVLMGDLNNYVLIQRDPRTPQSRIVGGLACLVPMDFH